MAGLGGFETLLLTPDIAALGAFYRALGFVGGVTRDQGPVRLERGDCRLSLGAAGGGQSPDTRLRFCRGDVAALDRDFGGEVIDGGGLALSDPDGRAVEIGSGALAARPAGAVDPVLGWYELSLPVDNIARTAGFYGRLGFEAADGDIAQRHLTLQHGDCRLCLYQGYLDPAEPQLIFWQGDVAGVADLAARKGLKVRKGLERNDDGHVSLMLEDPDGRPLYFIFIPGVERRQPAEEVD